MIEGKVWGTTELVLKTPLIEVHRLAVLPNARCSWHRHANKWNAFICLSGSLLIERKKREYDLIDVTTLHAGEMCTVPPGEVHRFVTNRDRATAIEFYYPQELAVTDIEREDVGGVDNASD
jgi:mannose-6-phosphate isomerase-like protein (cupin superfamily)